MESLEQLERLTEQLNERDEELRKIAWLLTKSTAENGLRKQLVTPEYGDLSQLNTEGVILRSVGKPLLTKIVCHYLELLETSSAVYELDGSYALGIFASGWCRMLDEAAWRSCQTPDVSEALKSERWHCHRSCWDDASSKSIETNAPVDVECSGGIRLYAVPIQAGNRVVGSMNFGYGDPPQDEKTLIEIAELYDLPVEKLRIQSRQYQTRPKYMIDFVKDFIGTSAEIIGALVERAGNHGRQ